MEGKFEVPAAQPCNNARYDSNSRFCKITQLRDFFTMIYRSLSSLPSNTYIHAFKLPTFPLGLRWSLVRQKKEHRRRHHHPSNKERNASSSHGQDDDDSPTPPPLRCSTAHLSKFDDVPDDREKRRWLNHTNSINHKNFNHCQKHKSLSQWDTSIVENILSKNGFILDFNGRR